MGLVGDCIQRPAGEEEELHWYETTEMQDLDDKARRID